MEITDKTITLVGVVAMAGIACVTFATGQTAAGCTCIGIIGGAIGVNGLTSKKAETQETENTASDLSTEDLVKEVDANTSLNDTTTPAVTELSDVEILNKAAAIIAAQNNTGNTETVVTQ